MYRQSEPGLKLRLELISGGSSIIGNGVVELPETGDSWKKATVSFTANDSTMRGKLGIWFDGVGTVDLDMISLFPSDTWKGRPGGMRADMVQLLADMKPGFLRFPGGCIVEGHDLSVRYQWKKTIGAIEDRQLIVNRWNTEFAHRLTPDYYQTFGLGFFEYFQLAEDIGAAPLPILNCGMACQFNTGEVVPLDQLDPYIRDALDLIEFANGDTATEWGAVRAKMGHPQPFNPEMMGVGNENWAPQYIERLQLFRDAIKAKYPDFKLVCSAGTDPAGERFDFLDQSLRSLKADIIDEHYYRQPAWFLENAGRYDNYDRNSAKIFAGEYAAQSDRVVSIHNRNILKTAIAEAAFMTGLERNAGVVVMASYAPLFAHIDGWQWTPDLIWVNNLQAYGTPDYYVQQLFSLNKGTHVVPVLQAGSVLKGQDSLYASAVLDKKEHALIVKVVNASGTKVQRKLNIEGARISPGRVEITTLTANSLQDMNSFDMPGRVAPKTTSVAIKGKQLDVTMEPNSFNLYRVSIK
ncbi:alpha-L-arabinofuranosidase [Chitinophaga sedimenti]|uniref:alpha-L-arabinofuranosidase C-terminal domain-containing protein n=1 Tax=Chitinophaga sedimenti TaxID=2033606 RepID=UPI002003F78A|nr:alpha-L-arabinofuranosidase C-terminal domain-containing protein [Chitinophaga sedimenti]MCK7555462.1 alpha-L-arabinofuranosidase [Chitinophaga sedimenti]